jgi:signal transduction histidine kinase
MRLLRPFPPAARRDLTKSPVRLPRRTVRLRLTALFGGLFLACGTALLTITNILAREWTWPTAFHVPPGQIRPPRGTRPGSPRISAGARQSQLILVHAHAAALNRLLVESLIALGVMAVVSVALGWLVAGRALRPLREMTAAARAISEDNLDARLAVSGPGDELTELGDTVDALLDRLQAAFDAQRNFVASASHELRTPLTLSRTLLQMALADPEPTVAGYQAVCEELLDAGDHQEHLIEALLTLARSQRGLDRRERLDLAAITRQVLDDREPDAAARGLTVSASITSAPVAGDGRLLERLAVNLIDNAIRHNSQHGSVDIEVAAVGGHPVLRIVNTGPVIPASQIPRLLQPFQRLHAGRPADESGLGLGLSIVAAIARAHRATLSASPGGSGGLDISVSFPPAGEIAAPQQLVHAAAG